LAPHFVTGIELVLPGEWKRTVSILFKLKSFVMLYLIAVILLIGWLLGFFVFSAGGIIHVLLVIAIIAILLRLIQGRNPV
jgi:hypothetical protein